MRSWLAAREVHVQVFLPEWIHSETGIGSPALFEKIVQNDSNDCHNVGAVEQLRTSDKPNQVKHKNQLVRS